MDSPATKYQAQGLRIFAAREAKGLKAKQLAARIGKDPRQIWRYESGRQLPEDPQVFQRLVEEIGATIEWVLKGGADGPVRDPAPGGVPDSEVLARQKSQSRRRVLSVDRPAVDAVVAAIVRAGRVSVRGAEDVAVIERGYADLAALHGRDELLTQLEAKLRADQRARAGLPDKPASPRQQAARKQAGEEAANALRAAREAKGHRQLSVPKKKTRS